MQHRQCSRLLILDHSLGIVSVGVCEGLFYVTQNLVRRRLVEKVAVAELVASVAPGRME